MFNEDQISQMRKHQEKVFQSGVITDEENNKLNIIHSKIEELSSIPNLTLEQMNDLTLLITQSGDIVFGTDLEIKHLVRKKNGIDTKLIVASVIVIAVICVVVYK
jgi:hypothetical protein